MHKDDVVVAAQVVLPMEHIGRVRIVGVLGMSGDAQQDPKYAGQQGCSKNKEVGTAHRVIQLSPCTKACANIGCAEGAERWMGCWMMC